VFENIDITTGRALYRGARHSGSRRMSISLLLDMAASNNPDRAAVVSGESRWTGAELDALAHGGAGAIAGSGARSVAYVATGGALLPLLIFASARAGVPFTPLNYRLSGDKLA